MKVYNIIFGVLSIIVAMICFAFPFTSQLTYGYIIAVFIGIMGIFALINYFTTRKQRKANPDPISAASGTASLIIGIFGVVFMLLNMTVPFFTYSVQEFGAILVALFMLTEGASSIASAVSNKNNQGTGARICSFLLGVIMIIAFLVALLHPAIIIAMFGIFLGMGMLIQGISRIALALAL